MTVTLDLEAAASDSTTRRTLTSLSTAVAKSKRIVVVTGAGISCSSGIPDFRSSDGLYALVKSRYPNAVLKGRDLFDASLFRDPTSTALFYTFMAELKSSIDLATPSPTHCFIKTLDTKGKLLRSYTQNIDGLEERAGLAGSSSEGVKSNGKGKSKIKTKEVRNVQLHGDIHRVRCALCAADFTCTTAHLEAFREGDPPDCSECLARSEARVARSARPLKVGTLRPCIVLYDEPHPLGDEIGAIQTADLAKKPDLLIIMGTSLKVHGLKKLVKDFARTVREHKSGGGKVVFVNKTPPAGEWSSVIDYHVKGETDEWTGRVVEDWKKARPQDWEVQQTLGEEGSFKVVKQTASKTKGGKKKAGNENVPPTTAPIVPPSKATAPSPTAPLPTAPLSPSKRAANASHYDDAENSPSKRRGAVHRPLVPATERGMLFTRPTNTPTNTLVEVVISKKQPKVKAKITSQKPVRAKRKVGAELTASISKKGAALECAIIVE